MQIEFLLLKVAEFNHIYIYTYKYVSFWKNLCSASAYSNLLNISRALLS